MQRVAVEAVVAKYGPKDYRAHVRRAAGPSVEGTGETAAEAKRNLAEAIAWAVHVEPGTVTDGEGVQWLAYPWGPRGQWCLRRLHADNGTPTLSRGSTIVGATNWSALERWVAEWNKPEGIGR